MTATTLTTRTALDADRPPYEAWMHHDGNFWLVEINCIGDEPRIYDIEAEARSFVLRWNHGNRPLRQRRRAAR